MSMLDSGLLWSVSLGLCVGLAAVLVQPKPTPEQLREMRAENDRKRAQEAAEELAEELAMKSGGSGGAGSGDYGHKKDDEKTDKSAEEVENEKERERKEFERHTENFIRNTKGIQEKFGVSEDSLRESLKQGQRSALAQGDGISIYKIIDWILIISAVLGLAYLLNKSTSGDFMRVIVGIFPTEAKALGIKDYFERVK